jgi:protoporphyrinogen oxidase
VHGMPTHRVAVIGAGPAGLTAAYQLARRGIKVTVYEASASVGGMAKTIALWGQLVDLGPHRFFSSDPRVNKIWLDIVGNQYSMVTRLTRINYRQKFFDYPLKPFNALAGLGLVEAVRCIFSYVAARMFPTANEKTFEDWVTNRFGRRLYRIFFKSYSEKLWGISCQELDAEFAAQRIKRLSLFEAIKSAAFKSASRKHRTIVDEFAYPHFGAGWVYEEMARRICALGGEIALRWPVTSVRLEFADGLRLRFSNGEEQSFDHVISTMPITQLVDRMGAPDGVRKAANELQFRNTILVYLRIRDESLFPDQWIYVHSPDVLTGRITNFRNWVPSITNGLPDTVLCLEYWCYDRDEIWGFTDTRLIELATAEIHKTSLVSSGHVEEGHVMRVAKSYPIYTMGYREKLELVQAFLSKQRGLSVIGRYGAFKYNNQDHSILMGALAAENIADGAKHDLWAINTDYEYQEANRIAATGLVSN